MNVCHYKCLPEKEKNCCTKTTIVKLNLKNDSKTATELFEMQPTGCSPLHSHKAQHTILVIEGEGIVFDGQKSVPLHTDDVVSIIANEPHQLKNTGKKVFKFLTITTQAKE
jgi:quercetin dioxygenase-like cupin family protein